MKCRDIMKTEVQFCSVNDTVSSAATRMRDSDVGFLPVCDDAGKAVGTITDRDLVLRVLADEKAGDTPIRDVMSWGVICCDADDSLHTAEDLMREHKKSRMICTDGTGKPVGVISLSDVANVERRGRTADVLKSVSQRELRM